MSTVGYELRSRDGVSMVVEAVVDYNGISCRDTPCLAWFGVSAPVSGGFSPTITFFAKGRSN